jgi:peptidase M28-like protein
MIDPRIYRAALVPVLLAFVLLAFSLENRPQPMRTSVPPDAFTGDRAFDRAYGSGEGLAARYPDRRPGSDADTRMAAEIAAQMRAADLRVRTVQHEADTIDGRQTLRTVIARRPGTSDEQIVVVAHRDAAGRGAEAELSGTAALLELTRIFGASRQARHTLTLVSTSGGSGGAAGAAELAREVSSQPVGAVLVLGDLASHNVRAPLVTPWSNALGASPQQLRATVQEAVRVETGSGSGPPRALSQFARYAMPATLGEQGALLAGGLPAVLLSIGGDMPPRTNAPISPARLEAYGRAALRTVTALDAASPERTITPEASSRDLLTSRKIVPAWAITLFTGVLLLTVLVTAVDALAALLRRRERVVMWLSWTLAGALPFLLTALFALGLALVGLLDAPGAPVSPRALPASLPVLLAVVLVFALGWVTLRPVALRLLRVEPADLAEPGAGILVVLVAAVAASVMWLANPYAAALLIPGLHIWLFALAPDLRMRRALRLSLVALGAVPAVVVAIALARALGLGVVDAAWELVLLTAGGHISAPSVVLWSIVAGCGVGALLVAAHGRTPVGVDEIPITVRGPKTYAGPGSLGGTESALRR